CGLYHEGAVFAVEISCNATVIELQRAIFEKRRYRERSLFAPGNLRLRLA
ncbi:hypothetical protein PHYSODRAFT_469264, partial [Phytophthora sojae]